MFNTFFKNIHRVHALLVKMRHNKVGSELSYQKIEQKEFLDLINIFLSSIERVNKNIFLKFGIPFIPSFIFFKFGSVFILDNLVQMPT